MEKITNSFNITTSDVIEDEGVFYLSVKQIAENLKTSKQNIRQILNRNKEEFEFWNGVKNEFPPYLEFKTAGGVQSGFVLNEQQVYVLCMLMTKNEKARKFRRYVISLLDVIKKGEITLQVNAQAKANQQLLIEVGTLREDLAKKELDLICAKSNIINKKKLRYLTFRSYALTRGEASRALNIPYKVAAEIDKTILLLRGATDTVGKLMQNQPISKTEQMNLLQGYDTARLYKTVTTA